MEDEQEKPEREVLEHTPKVFALRQPSLESCELVITTTTRKSHVYALTYSQVCLLASQAESARLNWPQPPKLEKAKP
jgi:hypothetical protein